MKIFDADVPDSKTRQNFTRIIELLRGVKSLLFMAFNWVYFNKTITVAGTYLIPHTLGAIPTDVILTRQSWASGTAGTVTISYTSFTKTTISATITGGTLSESKPLVIGGFVGRRDE